MQIIRTFIVACLLTLPAWAVSVVTGNVTDLGGSPVAGVTIRFTLRGCKTQPRVVGTGVPVRLVKDMVSDGSGHINDTIVRNDEITCQQLNDTFYEIGIVPALADAQPLRTKINTGSFDLSAAQDIAVATAPFTGLNVLLNPPASQVIRQTQGSSITVVGDGYSVAFQGITNAEHGQELSNVDGSRRWRFGQVAGNDPSYPANSFILRTANGNGDTQDFLNCVQDGETSGLGACTFTALFRANTQAKFDMTQAARTAPFAAGTVLPSICTPNIDFYVLTNGTGGQKLNICNASGNGWLLVGDGGAASAVTSFGGRQGDILPAAGDYSSISETMTNKTLDSTNNQIITRAKAYLQAAGCAGATAVQMADTPVSGAATANCISGVTNTALTIGSLTYVDGSTTQATFAYSLPADFQSSSSIDLRIHWMQTFSVGNPSQFVVWSTALACSPNGTTIDVAFNTPFLSASASAAKLQAVDLIAPALDATNCVGNGTLYITVQRLGADGSDTMTGSAQLLGVELTYVRNQ